MIPAPISNSPTAIAKGGRETVLPLLKKVMTDAVKTGALVPPADGDISLLFMHLLGGDQQVRRVIGTMSAPSARAVEWQAKTALAHFTAQCSPRAKTSP